MPTNPFRIMGHGSHSHGKDAPLAPSPTPVAEQEPPFMSPEDEQVILKVEYCDQTLALRKYSGLVRKHLDGLAAISDELSQEVNKLRKLDHEAAKADHEEQTYPRPRWLDTIKEAQKLLNSRDKLRHQLDESNEEPIPAIGYAPYDMSGDSAYNELSLLMLQVEQKRLSIIRASRAQLYATINRLDRACRSWVTDDTARNAMIDEIRAHDRLKSPHGFDWVIERHQELTFELQGLQAGTMTAEATDKEAKPETSGAAQPS
ncbi:hypothetical protein F5Y18DRAFT_427840 [Xylariaceae sp. FL1019]|nr:hypothetical protein F5Y18DRAFT_427840 [Xylariaceae sp. FL1019]